MNLKISVLTLKNCLTAATIYPQPTFFTQIYLLQMTADSAWLKSIRLKAAALQNFFIVFVA
jgi:hypothetical protein